MHAPMGKPLNCTVKSPDSGRTYTIRTDGKGILSCSCPWWLNQKKAIGDRSCKHIEQALRESGFAPARELRPAAVKCPPHLVNEMGYCSVCKTKVFEASSKPEWTEDF